MELVKKIIELNRKSSEFLSLRFPRFFGYPSYQDELLRRVFFNIERGKVRKVLEVGGIDRPLLQRGQGFIYDGLDIEESEKCYDVYDNFLVQSIEEKICDKYDSIISITLLEHVADNRSSIDSIYGALNQNGETHHYIPSKWHPYSVVLRILGPVLQRRLIPLLRPGAEAVSGYPAYFDNCSVYSIRKLLLSRGFTDINIKAYYRANDYFACCIPLFVLVTAFENLCKALNLDIFASGFVVSARTSSSDWFNADKIV